MSRMSFWRVLVMTGLGFDFSVQVLVIALDFTGISRESGCMWCMTVKSRKSGVAR